MDNKHIGATGKPNTFQKGMVTDTSPLNQPGGSYRFGLNLTKGTKEGDRDAKASEHGNEKCFDLPNNFYPIGNDYIDSNSKVVFAVDKDTQESIIAKTYSNCTFDVLIRSNCLGFSIEHQIQVVNRVRLGCEDVVYFTDDFNNVRAINLSDLPQYHSVSFKDHLATGKTEDSFIGEKWDCSKFDLLRDFIQPFVESTNVISGGQQKSGSVNFVVRLLDEDFNPSPFGPESGTVNVYRDFTNSTKSYEKVLGSSNVDTDPIGGTLNSGKAIEVQVTNLDQRFAFWQLGVIVSSSFTGKITDLWLSVPIPIDTTTFTVTGDYNSYSLLSLEEVREVRPDIQTAKTIAQQENQLLLGNVKGRKYDVCGFQKYASKICQEYVVRPTEIDDIHTIGDTKNPNTHYLLGSHQGDEVVSNAIVYVWPDGSETPAYHLPGPPLDTITCTQGSKKTAKQKCIKGEVALKFPCEPVRVQIEHKIEGATHTFDGYWEEHAQYEIYCGYGDYSFEVVSFSATCEFYGDNNIGKLVTTEHVNIVETEEEYDENCLFVNSVGEYVVDKNLLDEGWDSRVIPTWSKEIAELASEFDENGIPYEVWDDADKVQHWQLHNTAIKLSNEGGRPGYYACKNSVYPDIKDCDGKSIWGVDACGNPLTGTPIRHPRLPDRRLEPLIVGAAADEYEYCLTAIYKSPGGETAIEVIYTEAGISKKMEVTLAKTGASVKSTQILCSDKELVFIDYNLKTPNNSTSMKVVVNKVLTNKDGVRIANILGFKFSNIEYPHPDIVGHYFVTAVREDKDKTVADAGIIGRLHAGGDGEVNNVGFSYFTYGNQYPDLGFYFTPEFLVDGKETTGRQIAYQGQFNFSDKEVRCTDLDGAGSVFSNVDTIIDVRRQRYGAYTIPDQEFSPIEEIQVLDALAYNENYIGTGDLVNTSITNRAQILDTANSIPKDGEDLFYAYSRLYKDVYCDLFGIVYRNMTFKVLTLEDDQTVFGGDTVITPFNLNNIVLRSIYDSYWDDALKIVLIAASTALTIVTAGAAAPLIGLAIGGTVTVAAVTTAAVLAGVIGIGVASYQAMKERYKTHSYYRLTKDSSLNTGCSDDFAEDSFIAYAAERVEGLYVESQINFGLRQEIVGECGSLYQGEDILEFFKSKIVNYNEEEGKYEPKGIICPEVYWVNPDFGRVNAEKIYLPVPRTFKCCSDCLEEHRDRFHWSEQSFQEERSDNYRTFLPNNYKDIDAQHGQIINLVPFHQNLLIQAEDNLWVSVSSRQERVAGDVVTFLGTGAAYSIPERKVIDDDLGAVGCLHQWGMIKTKFGVFIPDEKENSLYLYSSGIKDLFVGNNKAWAHKFFKGHLKESLKKLTGEEFANLDNHANPDGLGIHSTYDPMFRRVLITKRDYEIIEKNFKAGKPQEAYAKKHKPLMYFIDGEFVLYDGQEYSPVSFDDIRYFRNRSFTLSYSPEDHSFVSFHSYIPLMYFRDKNTFFSSKDNSVWQHNADNVLSFYGKKHSSIIEGVNNTDPTIDKYTDYIAFFTEAKKFDGVGFVDVGPKTFDEVVAYNSTQSTGVLKIKINEDADILLESVTEDTDVIILGNRGKDFYINDIWDATKGEQISLFKDDWQSIAAQYFIDKVPNLSILDGISEWDVLSPLYDKYLIYRFTFTPKDDTSLIIHYVTPGSYRSQL